MVDRKAKIPESQRFNSFRVFLWDMEELKFLKNIEWNNSDWNSFPKARILKEKCFQTNNWPPCFSESQKHLTPVFNLNPGFTEKS